jgi:hypothetical protein
LSLLRSLAAWPLLALILIGCAGAGPPAANDAVRTQSRIDAVKRELEAVFASRMRAYDARDHATLVDQVSPAFAATRPDGTRMNREDLSGYIRRNLDRWVRITHQSNRIEGLRLEGDDAIADVRQALARIQIVDGREAVVESRVLQTETWTRTPAGWKLLSVRNEREQSLTIDGRPVG